MRILIETKVERNAAEVFAGFNRELFEYLMPPSFLAVADVYQGEDPGCRVRVRFKWPIASVMEVEIVERQLQNNESYFVDEGRKLPFPLKKWRHKHWVKCAGEGHSIIVDDIEFDGGYFWMNLLLYPVLYLAFYLRKPKYQSYFRPQP